MIRKELEGIHWLEFESFTEFKLLKHAIFLRHGGVSSGPFESLNFCSSPGDNAKNVSKNIRKTSELLKFSKIFQSHIIHSKIIQEVVPTDFQYTQCDGLATSYPEAGLMMTHADCQVAIFYDPIRHVVANVHAGWRGMVLNIYEEAVKFMQLAFACLPQNIFVGITPSLGPEDAEFINFKKELPESFWEYQIKSTYFDLWSISEKQLIEAGILPHHIEVARISTLSNPTDFFSYRREKVTGRHATVAMLL